MKVLIIVLSLFCTITTLSAQNVKLTCKDSLNLDRTWLTFKNALLTKDSQTLKSLSLGSISCDLFQSASLDQSRYMSINSFLRHIYQDQKIHVVLLKKGYRNHTNNGNGFISENVKAFKIKPFISYEIWYVIWEPNEFVKGHEGASDGFQFIKVNGQFKFYGLTSIP